MIPASHLLTFALLSFALIIVPGPNVLFVISRSLMLGRAAGGGTALGGQLGERSVAVFTVIKLAGAAYLVYLGVQALRNRQALSAALEGSTERKTIRRIVRDGFIVGASNPKAIIFFLAVLPQFVDRAAGHVPAQMLLLGAIFLAIAVLCDSSWALAAGTARGWLARSPRRLELVGGTGGLVMIGIGASLALTGRKD